MHQENYNNYKAEQAKIQDQHNKGNKRNKTGTFALDFGLLSALGTEVSA